MHKLYSSITLLTTSFYILGIDKGFKFPKKIKLCHKIISFAIALVLVVIITKDNIDKTFEIILWNSIYCLQYFIHVVYNVFFEEKSIKKTFMKITEVDKNLNIVKENSLGFQISALTTLVVGMKMLLTFALIYGRDGKASSLHILFASQICVTAIELEEVWRIFLVLIVMYKLHYIWKALKKIYPIEWFKEPVVNVLLPEVTQKKENDAEILKLVEAYQALVDSVEAISKNIQLAFTLRLCCNTMNLFILIYRFMSTSADVGNLASVLTSFIIGIIVSFILTLWPCILAELCESKTKDIKTILVQQALRTGIKENEKATIHRFISLINVRPISFYVFGVYKIDATLIVDAFNVCVTYTIFLLQSMNAQW